MRDAISADKTRAELQAWNQADPRGFVDHTFQLQAEVRRLRDLAAQNSRNSSRPPSTDGPEQPKPKSLRPNSGRKSGGQPGHPGRTLAFSQNPKHTEIHLLGKCACGEDLAGVSPAGYERRQVFDLPPLELACTEQQAEIKKCPGCRQTRTAPFPAGVTAPVQYGSNFRALLACFYDAQMGAGRRIREMCEELFGAPVSEGALQKARQEQFEALEPFEKRLGEILPREPVLLADETGVKVNKVTHWAHVLCTPKLTFFAAHPARGKEAIEAIGIIPRFTGWLMHDFLASYLAFDLCLHTFCKSHPLREWIFLFEQPQQAWAKDLHDLLLEMNRGVQARKALAAPWTDAELARWHDRYREVLGAGRQANPRTPAQNAQTRPKQAKEQNLLGRLEECEPCILAFLWAWELPFANNGAERAGRIIKVRLKIPGCFRTLAGARRPVRIRSYIATLRKHGLPVLAYLRRALAGRPFLPLGSNST